MRDSNNPEKYNEEFDKMLNQTEVITKEMLKKFHEAYSCDAATPYNWLLKKLKIIKERLDKGDILQFEDSIKTLDKSSFEGWIGAEFPYTKRDLI